MQERATIGLIPADGSLYAIDATVRVGELISILPRRPLWDITDLEAAALSLGWLLYADEEDSGRRWLYFRRGDPDE